MAKQITGDQEFYDLLQENKDKLILVDFFARWCGPCKKLSPRLEELAKKHKAKLLVLKVDVDLFGKLSSHVKSVPYLELYVKGKKKSSFVGFDGDAIQKMVEENL